MSAQKRILVTLVLFSFALVFLSTYISGDVFSVSGHILNSGSSQGGILAPFFDIISGFITGFLKLLQIPGLEVFSYFIVIFIVFYTALSLMPGTSKFFENNSKTKVFLALSLSLMIFFALGGTSMSSVLSQNLRLFLAFIFSGIVYIGTYTFMYKTLFTKDNDPNASFTGISKYVVSGIIAIVGLGLANFAFYFPLIAGDTVVNNITDIATNLFSRGYNSAMQSAFMTVMNLYNLFDLGLLLMAFFSAGVGVWSLVKAMVFLEKEHVIPTAQTNLDNRKGYYDMNLRGNQDKNDYNYELNKQKVEDLKRNCEDGINVGFALLNDIFTKSKLIVDNIVLTNTGAPDFIKLQIRDYFNVQKNQYLELDARLTKLKQSQADLKKFIVDDSTRIKSDAELVSSLFKGYNNDVLGLISDLRSFKEYNLAELRLGVTILRDLSVANATVSDDLKSALISRFGFDDNFDFDVILNNNYNPLNADLVDYEKKINEIILANLISIENDLSKLNQTNTILWSIVKN